MVYQHARPSLPGLLVYALAACSGAADRVGPEPGAGSNAAVVSGTLVDACLAPVSSAIIWVRGKGTTITDGSGHFEFRGVTQPYDIGYIAPAFANPMLVRIFQGVTRTDVRLQLPELGATRAGDLTGNLSGSAVAFPSPSDRISTIFFSAPEDLGTSHQLTESAYLIQPNWCGPQTETGTLHALQWTWTPGSGDGHLPIPTAYNGYGRLENVTVVNDTVLTGFDIEMSSIPATRLSGTITAPPGYAISSKIVGLQVGRTIALPDLVDDGSPDQSFDYLVPDIDGTSFSLEVSASSAPGGPISKASRRGIAPGTPLSLALRPPPTLHAPVPGENFVDLGSQTFAWSPFTGGLHLLSVAISEPGASIEGSIRFQVCTADTTARLPDPGELDFARVAPRSSGSWSVIGFTGRSVDDLLDPAGGGVGHGGDPCRPYYTTVGQPDFQVTAAPQLFQTR